MGKMRINKGYDYVIVGTGPGGGTVARELASGKKKILIIEYGPKLNKTGFWNVAPRAFLDKTKRALRSNGDIWFGRVRVLGGGSYVAMGNAASPPRHTYAGRVHGTGYQTDQPGGRSTGMGDETYTQVRGF